jgi:drug/metabolite transporter (DMT)-like permease
MQNDNLKAYLKLHLIVFIWGFTAILGALISINSEILVWYRLLIASGFIFFSILFRKKSLKIQIKFLFQLIFVGLLIALHWIFFFKAIKTSNVSITLSIFSIGAFITSLLEPLFYNRKVLWYEVFFGVLIMAALAFVLQVEINYFKGIIYALISIILGVLFTLINGKLIAKQDSSVITLYEFLSGVGFISVYFLMQSEFTFEQFTLSIYDFSLLLILASVCTAYAFTVSVKLMDKLTPYTVMLTTSLEPVYGIVLAYFIIGEKEKMSIEFYVGASIILITVILNGILKQYNVPKK